MTSVVHTRYGPLPLLWAKQEANENTPQLMVQCNGAMLLSLHRPRARHQLLNGHMVAGAIEMAAIGVAMRLLRVIVPAFQTGSSWIDCGLPCCIIPSVLMSVYKREDISCVVLNIHSLSCHSTLHLASSLRQYSLPLLLLKYFHPDSSDIRLLPSKSSIQYHLAIMPPIKLNVTLLTPDALDAAIKTVSFTSSTYSRESNLTVVVVSVQVAGLVTPSPPAGLTDKHRWMQCTVMNETQFPLVYQGTYYSSGKYWTAPCSMASFQEIVFSVCNGDGTFLTGATGGTAFNLVLDTSHIFQVAFVSPLEPD